MQEVQLLTREDIVEIVERELKGQFQAFRDEMLTAYREAVEDALRSNLSEIAGTIIGQELKSFRQEILDALAEAVRQVTEERSFSGEDPGDEFRQ
ncbi:MAG: hypothetical protein HY913_03190 [Desulfomonile tiedjei]|nr:hypothetical protein [Desulfomonile tiedjei]